MKTKSLLMAMLMLLSAGMAKAAFVHDVYIGEREETNFWMPVCMYYNYSLTQQIYMPAEICYKGKILSISFYYVAHDQFSLDGVQLYMKNVSRSTFQSSSDMEPVSESDKVWEGTFSATDAGWVTITLDKPFAYNGTDNLLVCFCDPTNGYLGTSYRFSTYNSSSVHAITYCSDDKVPSLTDNSTLGGTVSRWTYRNSIKLCIQSGNSEPDDGIIEIGNSGTSNVSVIPTSSYWNYSLTQQIYTKEEIGGSATLKSISFLSDGGKDIKRNLDIYLVPTGKTKFDGNTDWIYAKESDKVFSGEVNIEAQNWTVITFNKEFQYDGTENLAVIVDDNSGSYISSTNFYSYDVADDQTIYVKSDGTNYDPVNPSGYNGTLLNVKNCIKFNEEPPVSFDKPTEVKANDITFESALITWEGEASKWKLEYKKEGNFYWTSVDGITTNSYQLTGLEEDDVYLVRVQADYGGGNVSRWGVVRFSTPVKYPQPTNLSVTNTTPYSTSLRWIENSNATQWMILLKNTITDEEEFLNVSSNPCFISDLEPETTYSVQVRSIIGDESSHWSDVFSFTTLPKNPVPFNLFAYAGGTEAYVSWTGYSDSYDVRYRKSNATFFEDFEHGLGAWTVYTEGEHLLSEGWFVHTPYIFNYVDANMEYITAFGGSVTAMSFSWYDNVAYASDNWLITPKVGLGGTLKFWNVSDATYPDSFEVLLSTTGNAKEDFTTTLRPMQSGDDVWTEVSIDLSAYAGEGYIAIHHVSADKLFLFIDDFGIYPDTPEEAWSTISTTEEEVTISGLEPGAPYEIQVIGHVAGEEDAETRILKVMTESSHMVPYFLEVLEGETSAEISWSGNSDSYKVMYRTPARQDEKVFFFEDFEDVNSDLPDGWTAIDADGDGFNWQTYSYSNWAYKGNNSIASASYDNNESAPLTPDNWLITPLVDLKGEAKAWCRGLASEDCYEHFAFYVSTKGTDPSDFEPVSTEYVTSNMYQAYTADLSAYEGKKGYVAIRHFNTTDMYYLLIDNFGIYGTPKQIPAGEWHVIETTGQNVVINDLERETRYEYQIIGMKEGEPEAATGIHTFTTRNLECIEMATSEDNENLIAENNFKTVNVRIKGRTFRKDGRWESLCLPFDVDVEGSVLEGADVRTAEFVTRQNNFLIVHCLTPVKTLQAGVPYIIKWDGGEDIVDPVFTGVTITDSNNPITLYDDKVKFGGIYYSGYATSDFLYLVNGGLNLGQILLEYESTINAFDCYFRIDSDLNDTLEGIGLNVGNMSETLVGISAPSVSSVSSEDIYNLAGQRLSKIQKGVNIVSGKKMLVK